MPPKPPTEMTGVWMPPIPSHVYNFEHALVQEVQAPASVVVWNIIDFAHVNWVHRGSYGYCKVLARSRNIHLLEYGVRTFFFLRLPFCSPTLMWHEYVSPQLIRHLSRGMGGRYVQAEMALEEFQAGGQTHTRVTHTFRTSLPAWMLLFRRWIEWYLKAWSLRLWKEDLAMIERRQRVLQAGFRDHPLDVLPTTPEGFVSSR